MLVVRKMRLFEVRLSRDSLLNVDNSGDTAKGCSLTTTLISLEYFCVRTRNILNYLDSLSRELHFST